MELHLDGKVIAITGGSDGIGKAAALEFAREGCKISICGRNRDKLEEARTELLNLGCEVYAHKADVTVVSEIQEFVTSTYKYFGGLDVWINNAGATFPKPILECTEDDWDYSCALNLKSVFFGSQFAMRNMIHSGTQGVILNISTYATIIPAVGASIYAATKSGINSLTRTFAAECAPYGIRVVSAAPGTTNTEMTYKSVDDTTKKALLDGIAARRFGEPEESAYPIVFLASDAARYVNGVFLEVSGGKFCVQNPSVAWMLE